LILHRGALSQGTLLTLQICRELGKPVCLVDANTSSPEEAALTAQQFIEQHGIERLNVAGPRRSHWTQSYHYALDAVRALIFLLWHDDWRCGRSKPARPEPQAGRGRVAEVAACDAAFRIQHVVGRITADPVVRRNLRSGR
jgi:hypothetical protein